MAHQSSDASLPHLPPPTDSMVDLLNRATNPSNRADDRVAIHAFCERLSADGEAPQRAVRLLAHKIQSPQEREALQGLVVLEECVKKGDARLHQEIGKFRFLNEMIKIVSPKYLGNLTTESVKSKTVRLMFEWTKSLSSEPKIFEAYNMLRRQGIISEDPMDEGVVEELMPPPPTLPPREDLLFKDEEKQKLLQRLLRSKSPEDHQAANRLIKSIVKEEEERKEKSHKRQAELEKVHNSVKLLKEMVDAFDGSKSYCGSDRELMKELHDDCEKLRPNLFKLASDAEDEAIADILKANDDLVKVLEAYQTKVALNAPVKLLDVSELGGEGEVNGTTTILKSAGDDFLTNDLNSLSLGRNSQVSEALSTSTASLADKVPAFPFVLPATEQERDESHGENSSVTTDLKNLLLEPLQATLPAPASSLPDWSSFDNVFNANVSAETPTPAASTVDDLLSAFEKSIAASKKSPAPTDIFVDGQKSGGGDARSENDFGSSGVLLDAPLLQPQNAPVPPFFSSKSGTVTSSSFAKTDSPLPASPTNAKKGLEVIGLMSQGLLENTMKEFGVSRPDITSSTSNPPALPAKLTLSELQQQKEQQQKQKLKEIPCSSSTSTPEEKYQLNNIFVSLESIKPSEVDPLSIYDKHGIKIILFFSQVICYPSPNIAVMILTTMSTNTSPLKSYEFSATAASESTLIKLQAPTADHLPPFNPILPPSAISQILLLANPNKESVKLEFEVRFSLGDASYLDSGETLPLPSQIFF